MIFQLSRNQNRFEALSSELNTVELHHKTLNHREKGKNSHSYTDKNDAQSNQFNDFIGRVQFFITNQISQNRPVDD